MGAACALLCLSLPARGQTPVVLDRVVAVVNDRAILSSDLAAEKQLAVLEPQSSGGERETDQDVLDRLISRVLIRQQIREEDAQAAIPGPDEVAARLGEIRRELPLCVRARCATDEGWKAFLAAHQLTQAQVENYLRDRLEILRFIELRFRQGIRIPEDAVDTYYNETLLPQYQAGQTPPPLAQVAPRIEEILLQQQVNALFNGWLDSLRRQGDVEVLDPALEGASAQPASRGADAP